MSKEHIVTINPATEEKLNEYKYLTDKELKDNIEACNTAFLDWKLKPVEERAKIIEAIKTKEGQVIPTTMVGKNNAGEVIAKFSFTWTIKARTPKKVK